MWNLDFILMKRETWLHNSNKWKLSWSSQSIDFLHAQIFRFSIISQAVSSWTHVSSSLSLFESSWVQGCSQGTYSSQNQMAKARNFAPSHQFSSPRTSRGETPLVLPTMTGLSPCSKCLWRLWFLFEYRIRKLYNLPEPSAELAVQQPGVSSLFLSWSHLCKEVAECLSLLPIFPWRSLCLALRLPFWWAAVISWVRTLPIPRSLLRYLCLQLSGPESQSIKQEKWNDNIVFSCSGELKLT